jgi:beta-glucosidase/6-phospho-beta-glucosidase/beta-galactosidase
VLETTRHAAQWRGDLALLAGFGVSRLRYPVRWHRVEREPGVYDWRDTDVVLGHLRQEGFLPIVDLVHHTSYPRWLAGGFADPRFAPAYLRYCETFARRYPWVRQYTLFNEPFSTLFLCGHEAIWPPYARGLEALVAMFGNVLPALSEASRMYADLLPGGEHIYNDTCERHTSEPGGEDHAALANDRRFFVLDLLMGRDLNPDRPFVAALLEAGGEPLLSVEPARVDVLGLDYYAHCQWHYSGQGGSVPSPAPASLADLIVEYASRYGLPCALFETNVRGFASDRASWLKYTLEQYEIAERAGVDLRGYCWFPFIDSCDWDTLLYHPRDSIDPVGVLWLDGDMRRRESEMSTTYALAAAGAPAADLPAYRFRAPVAGWLRGYLPQIRHWDWRPAPGEPDGPRAGPSDDRIELRIKDV